MTRRPNKYQVRKVGNRWWVEKRGHIGAIAGWWMVSCTHSTHSAAMTHADRLARPQKHQGDYGLAGG